MVLVLGFSLIGIREVSRSKLRLMNLGRELDLGLGGKTFVISVIDDIAILLILANSRIC